MALVISNVAKIVAAWIHMDDIAKNRPGHILARSFKLIPSEVKIGDLPSSHSKENRCWISDVWI